MIVWAGIGLLTLRVLVHFGGLPAGEDENFFLGFAMLFGPIFTVVIIITGLCVLIAWAAKRVGIPKVLRKAAGFE